MTAAVSIAGNVRAQGGSSEAAATALFDEGRKLMNEHRYADACPKLAESQQLAPSGGTLINLAECYEHTGQSASAWVAWKGAAARANAAGKRDVEQKAIARAAALEPSLARLTIAVEKARNLEGLVVKRDGIPVGQTEFGMGIPVDPGPHVIEATAPNKKPFSARVDVAPKQASAQVTVALEDEPVVAAPAAPATPSTAPGVPSTPQGGGPVPVGPDTESHPSNTQRTIGWILGGVGIAGVAVGTVFGLQAKSKNDEALQSNNCRTSMYCTPAGLSLTSDAKNAATLSTVAFAVGIPALVAGAVLWITAPSPQGGTGLRATPVVGQSYQGVALDGAF
jgi:hypothetical protein